MIDTIVANRKRRTTRTSASRIAGTPTTGWRRRTCSIEADGRLCGPRWPRPDDGTRLRGGATLARRDGARRAPCGRARAEFGARGQRDRRVACPGPGGLRTRTIALRALFYDPSRLTRRSSADSTDIRRAFRSKCWAQTSQRRTRLGPVPAGAPRVVALSWLASASASQALFVRYVPGFLSRSPGFAPKLRPHFRRPRLASDLRFCVRARAALMAERSSRASARSSSSNSRDRNSGGNVSSTHFLASRAERFHCSPSIELPAGFPQEMTITLPREAPSRAPAPVFADPGDAGSTFRCLTRASHRGCVTGSGPRRLDDDRTHHLPRFTGRPSRSCAVERARAVALEAAAGGSPPLRARSLPVGDFQVDEDRPAWPPFRHDRHARDSRRVTSAPYRVSREFPDRGGNSDTRS